ncbi:MAG: phosphoglucosamine mutase, partial [Ginsengibacter sp.]
MALIKSISGIRGTIGGKPGENLTPLDLVKFTSAFAAFLESTNNRKIVVGRDGRISGKMVSDICVSTLVACGYHVVDLGITTTPTVEMAVKNEKAA